jgi:hypothetical protein
MVGQRHGQTCDLLVCRDRDGPIAHVTAIKRDGIDKPAVRRSRTDTDQILAGEHGRQDEASVSADVHDP